MKKDRQFRPNVASGNKRFARKRLHDDTKWSEYSVKFLSVNSRCYACGERARVTDHIVSAKGDEKLFWDITNLIPLCKRDHDTITAKFDRAVVADTEGKMRWIEARRQETGTTVKVKILRRDLKA
jgi:5-methylcytosine-specific restriction endonuclease McrA